MPDGTPVAVKSQRQLSSLCNEHKLVHMDDPRYEPKPQKFVNPHDLLQSKDTPETRRGLNEGAGTKEQVEKMQS